MRIGDYELRNMRNKIMDTQFRISNENIKKRKIDIAKLNREYYLEKHQYIIDQLPKEMVSHDTDYDIRIKYTPPKSSPFFETYLEQGGEKKTYVLIDEKWTYKTDSPMINPVEHSNARGHYSHVPEHTLNPRLEAITAKLCEDILLLQAEKKEQLDYLEKTTQMYTGSVGLRKAWPESLHKYLPNEPIKVARKVRNAISGKLVKAVDPVAPASLKTRMTINLLEGK